MAQGRCPNHSPGFAPVRFPGSPPLAKPLSETQVHIEGLLVLQHVVTRPRQLVRERLERQDPIRSALLAIIETPGLRTAAQRKVRRFHERPGEILVAVPGVAFALPLAVALLQAVDTAPVRTEVPYPTKSNDGGRQDLADAWHGLEQAVLRTQDHSLLEPLLERLDLLRQRLADRTIGLHRERNIRRKSELIDLLGRQPFDRLALQTSSRLPHQDALDR